MRRLAGGVEVRAVLSLPAHPGLVDPSTSESWNQKVIATYSEFFAASVGNVDWLRFCVNPERKEIVVDDKVKLAAWRQTEFSQHPIKYYP